MATRRGAAALDLPVRYLSPAFQARPGRWCGSTVHLQPSVAETIKTNLIHAARGPEVTTVLIGGRVVVKDGRLVDPRWTILVNVSGRSGWICWTPAFHRDWSVSHRYGNALQPLPTLSRGTVGVTVTPGFSGTEADLLRDTESLGCCQAEISASTFKLSPLASLGRNRCLWLEGREIYSARWVGSGSKLFGEGNA